MQTVLLTFYVAFFSILFSPSQTSFVPIYKNFGRLAKSLPEIYVETLPACLPIYLAAILMPSHVCRQAGLLTLNVGNFGRQAGFPTFPHFNVLIGNPEYSKILEAFQPAFPQLLILHWKTSLTTCLSN